MPKRNGPGIELLADPTRRRIIAALALGPRRPSSLAAELRLSRPAVSRQLRLLRDATLVDTTRSLVDGRVVLYRLQPGQHGPITAWLAGTERRSPDQAHPRRGGQGPPGLTRPRSADPGPGPDPTPTRPRLRLRPDPEIVPLAWNHLACGLCGGRFPRDTLARRTDEPTSRRPRCRTGAGQPMSPPATMTLHGPGSDRRWTTRLRERRPRRRHRRRLPPGTTPQPPGATRGASATKGPAATERNAATELPAAAGPA